ncbi:MAG: hypothetical protein PHR35_00145 [Kiritimatiellae bacterium]|nr:hypothetical protein [Kiritimatiellia bacterium]
MSKKTFLLFLAGCFSLTQVKIVGYIGVSELVFYAVAPFIFVQDQERLRKHGFNRVLLLAAMWAANGLLTDIVRHNTFDNTVKGFAATYSVLSCLIVLHHLLWDDVWRVRWMLLGITASIILSLFFLQGGVYIQRALTSGENVASATMSYKLTIISIVTSLLALPIFFQYMRFPIISALCVIGAGYYGLLQGGRSTFLIMLMTASLMLIVRNNPIRMRSIHRTFYGLAVAMILAGVVASSTYKYVVTKGMMGEEELEKYEAQSQAKIGLLSGRSAFIGSVLAIRDSPILGYGSWALDVYGYGRRSADIAGTEYHEHGQMVPYMPGHSHVFGSWVNNGICGGVFWIYILYLLYKTVKYNMGVVPNLFGYLAWTIPGMAWAILFSPFAGRPIPMTAITVMLLLEHYRRAAARARWSMPRMGLRVT